MKKKSCCGVGDEIIYRVTGDFDADLDGTWATGGLVDHGFPNGATVHITHCPWCGTKIEEDKAEFEEGDVVRVVGGGGLFLIVVANSPNGTKTITEFPDPLATHYWDHERLKLCWKASEAPTREQLRIYNEKVKGDSDDS